MIDALNLDYANLTAIIVGKGLRFDDVPKLIMELEPNAKQRVHCKLSGGGIPGSGLQFNCRSQMSQLTATRSARQNLT
jgi:hypothetical protein